MDGFRRMVWTTAHFDRNHWNPEEPMKSIEVFVANEYRAKNSDAQIRLINWDPPMTHYGHLELPKQLAAAHFSVVRCLVRPLDAENWGLTMAGRSKTKRKSSRRSRATRPVLAPILE